MIATNPKKGFTVTKTKPVTPTIIPIIPYKAIVTSLKKYILKQREIMHAPTIPRDMTCSLLIAKADFIFDPLF
jgi:hypothetical protein